MSSGCWWLCSASSLQILEPHSAVSLRVQVTMVEYSWEIQLLMLVLLVVEVVDLYWSTPSGQVLLRLYPGA